MFYTQTLAKSNCILANCDNGLFGVLYANLVTSLYIDNSEVCICYKFIFL